MICPKWHVGQVGQEAKKPYGGFFVIEIPTSKKS
jgi:hypothetical protein